MLKSIPSCAAAVMLVVGAAVAQSPSAVPGKDGRGEFRTACQADVTKLCAGVEKDKGGRMGCLRANLDKLEPACRAAVDQRIARIDAVRQACKTDRKTLCGTVPAGRGAIAECMKANTEKLSPACREAMAR